MSVRPSASRNVSTDTSRSMFVSDRNTLTLRPVACSTTLMKSSAICCWKRRRMCSIASFSPRSASLLRARERLLEHHDDEVLDDVGLRPRRALAVVLGLETHDLLGDRRSHLPQRTPICHRLAALSASRRHVPAGGRLMDLPSGESRPASPPAAPVAGRVDDAAVYMRRARAMYLTARCSRAHGW